MINGTGMVCRWCACPGTHKERVRYNAKLSADSKEISQVLDEYNQLRVHGKLDRPAATLEQIRAAEFPWVDENREGGVFERMHADLQTMQ